MDLLALLISSFLAATILPFASEVPRAVVVRHRGDLLLPVSIATLGNFAGACTTYGLARLAGARLIPSSHGKKPRALTLFERYGAPSLVLSWVPVVGDAIVALAGAARVPVASFTAWTLAGKVARYAAVGWIALNV